MSITARCTRQTTAGDDLLKAVRLVESAAFDVATSQPSEVVSNLILIAADLERLALLIGTSKD